jgi:hypothetical protein
MARKCEARAGLDLAASAHRVDTSRPNSIGPAHASVTSGKPRVKRIAADRSLSRPPTTKGLPVPERWPRQSCGAEELLRWEES